MHTLFFLLLSLLTKTCISELVTTNATLEYTWTYINFTWPSRSSYLDSVKNGKYIPENNVLAGIRIYGNKIYFSLPRIRIGTPVTLSYMSKDTRHKNNNLLSPYPSWKANVKEDCSTIQNVKGFEISTQGIMWVLDGFRKNRLSDCPVKIMLLDIKNGGENIHTYHLPNEISLSYNGLLNDIVIDETDGDFAYISDTSGSDPGLIVYSRKRNIAWKLRDKSMFADITARNFDVDNWSIYTLVGINGLALTPLDVDQRKERTLYYTSLNGYEMFSINTNILKDQNITTNEYWRPYIKYHGNKPDISDAMYMDNRGIMFIGLIGTSSLGAWNTSTNISEMEIVYTNSRDFIWPDTMTMDKFGNLYVTINSLHKYFNPQYVPNIDGVKFRVYRHLQELVAIFIKKQ